MKLYRLITIPLALLIIAFAVANRHAVLVSLDPFSQDAPALAFKLPLWSIAFCAFVGGLILGGLTAWVSRLSRQLRRGLQRRAWAKAEKAAAKATANDPLAGLPMITPRAGSLAPPRHPLAGRKSEPTRAAS